MTKAFTKNVLYHSLNLSGVLQYARRSHRKEVLILTYHGVLQTGSESYVNRNCVSAKMFELQMRWLKRYYAVLPLSEILDGLEGKRPLPDYAVAITFDDGFRNNYTIAFPILLKYDLPATIFLTTDFIGQKQRKLWTEHVDAIIQASTARRLSLQMNGDLATFDVYSKETKEMTSDRIRRYLKSINPVERDKKILSLEVQADSLRDCIDEVDERYTFLSWDEIRTMAGGGIEFGSHTATHSILATLSPDEARSELEKSRNEIESQLQKKCELFSYPNGSERDFAKRDQAFLQELGYRAALSQINGFNLPGDDLYALKRINIARSKNFAYFIAKITGVQPKLQSLL